MTIALLAGVGVAIATSLIGVFVLWKRMAYFGDAISHSAIFGLGIATIISVQPIYGIIFCSIIFCFLIFILNSKRLYSFDSIIGIVSCALVALGMILLSIFPSEIDVEDYLFGDLINLQIQDLALIYLVAIITSISIGCWFKKLLLATINSDLAKISGIPVEKLELKFLLLTALVVACLVKIVGIFLITSMIIMPAAIARNFAKNPLQMLLIALIVAVLIIIIGLFFALSFNFPTGPSIITIAALFLIVSTISGSYIK
ncbi:MAG: znuB [Rickettsiaceae bacterium]|jgi:zinc transport system permease protein|nr:znuB [Rickettsiaceae bacterium]